MTTTPRVRARFRPYPAYKATGVDWLGEIPAHWTLHRLKNIADVRLSNVDKKSSQGETPVRLCNYVDVYYNDRITEAMDFMAATASDDQIKRFALKRGDVLITKDSESWNDIAVPAVVDADLSDVLCGYHLALLRPKSGVSGAFLARSFVAKSIQAQFHVAANGITRFGLTGDSIAAGLFPIPPTIEEQDAIASFLDRETARIDELIANKRRTLNLLDEKRSTIVTDAVTKGLDRNVPLRRADVGWFDYIPAHWRVLRLRHILTRIEQGWSPECLSRQAEADEWGVLKAGCVNNGVFNEKENKALPAELEPATELEIRAGDLLMSRASGSKELVGSVALVEASRPRLLLCDKVFRLHFQTEKHDPRFLFLAMNSRPVRAQIESVVSGGSGLANNIPQAAVKDLWLAVPERSEQSSIARAAAERIDKVERIVRRTIEALTALVELRSALVSNAVLGKINVCDMT